MKNLQAINVAVLYVSYYIALCIFPDSSLPEQTQL